MAFKHAAHVDGPEAGKYEVAGMILRETAKGVLFNDGAGHEAWLPRKSIHISPLDRQGRAVVFMPEWLAKKEKFV
ncbi:MAG TPA: hypothetical protein PK857_00470 [Hyphomicrobium sp.]|nr:hypothetical protein [Hyphomicrobium sp.]HRO48786.1 hypothetical protein [Hyphomicrobium sp.]